jgi:hypothetical protein
LSEKREEDEEEEIPTQTPKPKKDSEKQKLHNSNGWEKTTSTGTHHGGSKNSIAHEG